MFATKTKSQQERSEAAAANKFERDARVAAQEAIARKVAEEKIMSDAQKTQEEIASAVRAAGEKVRAGMVLPKQLATHDAAKALGLSIDQIDRARAEGKLPMRKAYVTDVDKLLDFAHRYVTTATSGKAVVRANPVKPEDASSVQ